MMSSESASTPDDGGAESSSGRADDPAEKLFQVVFDLPGETATWAPAAMERLWFRKTPVRWEVEVRNTPFYVTGIALGDIIKIRADHDRREFVFGEEVIARSGHSTVQTIIMDETSAEEVANLIDEFGCSREVENTGILWAVDIPPHADYETLKNLLFDLREAGKIGVQEALIASNHRGG